MNRIIIKVEDLFGEYGQPKVVRHSNLYAVTTKGDAMRAQSELEEYLDDNRTPYGVGSFGWTRSLTIAEVIPLKKAAPKGIERIT